MVLDAATMTPDFGPALPSPCTHVESGIRLWVARYCQMLCMSPDQAAFFLMRCFRHQLLLPSPYLVLTKPLKLDIQCQRAASVKIGWKSLDD